MTQIDKPTRVRNGEEFDEKRIETFLKDSIPGLSGKLSVQQFPSGYSNLTYLISVGDRNLVLRRPPHGTKARTAHDMGREYRILEKLRDVFPYCPGPLVYSEDESIMGAPFYVMERIEGTILRRDLPEGLTFSPEEARTLCHNMFDVLIELHSIDYRKIGLEDFGKPEGYIKRQVEGWSRRYRAARTPDAPDYEEIMEWLDKNQPADFNKPSIIHNDYKFDNIVLDPQNPLKIIGVLDWEMATIGDPLMDLGGSIAYWITKDDSEEVQMMRLLPTHIDGMMRRKEIVQYYLEQTGISLDDFSFYECCNLFRVATIGQQIYYRYYHGQTKDKRFAMLIGGVQIIERKIRSILEKYD